MTNFHTVVKRFAEAPVCELLDDTIFFDQNGNPTVMYKQPECSIKISIDVVGDHCLRIFQDDSGYATITAQGNEQDEETAILAPQEMLEDAVSAVNNGLALIMTFINRVKGD